MNRSLVLMREVLRFRRGVREAYARRKAIGAEDGVDSPIKREGEREICLR